MESRGSMSNILVVTGSVRPNSVNGKVVPLVVDVLGAKGATVTIADLGEINLPFFNSPMPPSAPNYVITDEYVQKWTDLVDGADGVVLVTPEYNHTLSPIQLNAIDWIFKEWKHKPVALVGYGARSGATQAHATAREALSSVLSARVADSQTNLYFTRDLGYDGSVLDAEAVNSKISETIDELMELVSTTPAV